MKKIKWLTEKEQKNTVRLQMYYFYLNILCVCKQDDFHPFFNEYFDEKTWFSLQVAAWIPIRK